MFISEPTYVKSTLPRPCSIPYICIDSAKHGQGMLGTKYQQSMKKCAKLGVEPSANNKDMVKNNSSIPLYKVFFRTFK